MTKIKVRAHPLLDWSAPLTEHLRPKAFRRDCAIRRASFLRP